MLKMYVEELHCGATGKTTTVKKITEDDKVLAEFDEAKQGIDFTVLKDKVGQEIVVQTNDQLPVLRTIDSVEWDEVHKTHILDLK